MRPLPRGTGHSIGSITRAKVLGEAIAEDRDRIVFRRIFNQVREPSDARRT